jgi:ribosomal protein S18 acetylase RimI-like enzyme
MIFSTHTTPVKAEPQILALQQSQMTEAAKLMANTFFGDPFASYLIPDDRHRLAILQRLWHDTLQHDWPFHHIYTSNRFTGIASWVPPKATTPSLWESLPLIGMAFSRVGWRSTSRLLTALAATEAYRHRDCPMPHWYLDGLAVSPSAQGQGLGSLLLQPVLQQADRQGAPCYLYTSTDRAVRFYQRQGFVVVRDALQILKDAPPLWMMMRSPQTQAQN